MPDAGAVFPDSQRISKATNKRAPGSYLNKGSIVRVWRAAPFSTGVTSLSCIQNNQARCIHPSTQVARLILFFPHPRFPPKAILISLFWTGIVVVFSEVCQAWFHFLNLSFSGEFGGVLEVCVLADHAGILGG